MLLPLALLLSSARPVICIDPGHPSEIGRGTKGKHLTEIHAAWIVAKELKAELEHEGYRVVLTKPSEETFVRNRARAEVANHAHAALMLRLHCDSSNGSGFAVYYPDRVGKAEGHHGPSANVIALSKAAAAKVHATYARRTKGMLRDNGLLPDIKTAVGKPRGALIGSVFSKVPVVLVEMCTLTSVSDEAVFTSQTTRRIVVEALALGVVRAVRLRH